MQGIELAYLALAWIAFVVVTQLLKALGVKVPVKVHYGIFFMLRNEDLVRQLLGPMGRALAKVPNWLLLTLPTSVFLVSMFLFLPVPLVIVGVETWIPSMMMLVLRNMGAVFSEFTKEPTPERLVGSGFVPLAPLVPGVTIPLTTFVYIMIGVGLGIMLHELAHGALAIRYGARIKSGGAFALFFIAFGGFVEIDEEDLRRLRLGSKLAIFAGGVFMNVALAYAATAAVLAVLSIPPLAKELLGTVVVRSLNPSIPEGSVIVGVNGQYVAGVYDLAMRLRDALWSQGMAQLMIYQPAMGQLYTMEVTSSNLNISIVAPSTFYIHQLGIAVTNRPFFDVMFWIFNMNVTLALLNSLPAYPLDGGQFTASLLASVIKREAVRNSLVMSMSAILWAMVGVTVYVTISTGLYRLI